MNLNHSGEPFHESLPGLSLLGIESVVPAEFPNLSTVSGHGKVGGLMNGVY